jgi:predicted transcriptional regulator
MSGSFAKRNADTLMERIDNMEIIKLFDSELKVMEIIWEKEPVTAKEIGLCLKDSIGWNKNTTYTIIKKLIEKQIVSRKEPNFICTSLVKKADIQKAETDNLIEKLYNGSKKKFFAAFLQNEKLTEEEMKELKDLIDKSKP